MHDGFNISLEALLAQGSWIVATPDEPLLRPEQAATQGWAIYMPAHLGAWVPFHLIKESFRVDSHES